MIRALLKSALTLVLVAGFVGGYYLYGNTYDCESYPIFAYKVPTPDPFLYKGVEIVDKQEVDGLNRICVSRDGDSRKETIERKPVAGSVRYGTATIPTPTPTPTPIIYYSEPEDSYGGAICNDGTRSYSTGRGTCSWHGGVDYWL